MAATQEEPSPSRPAFGLLRLFFRTVGSPGFPALGLTYGNGYTSATEVVRRGKILFPRSPTICPAAVETGHERSGANLVELVSTRFCRSSG